jgi:hypothetical protein
MACDWARTALVILLSVASVPVVMGLGVLAFMLWNMLRGKGGWPQ